MEREPSGIHCDDTEARTVESCGQPLDFDGVIVQQENTPVGRVMQVAHGQAWVQVRSPLLGGDFRAWIGWGLALAAATGLASWLFVAPFLTSTYDYPWIPGVGGVPLASASAFDLGVYLVVVGATMTMLLAIARLSMPAFLPAPPALAGRN